MISHRLIYKEINYNFSMLYLPLLYSSYLNEDVHVSYVFDNVLDDIIKVIQYQMSNSILNETYTKFVYEPGIREVLFYSDLNAGLKTGYPIFVKPYLERNTRNSMRISPTIKDRIVIEYNVAWVYKIKSNSYLVKEALKHEFLHVVETYVKNKMVHFNPSDYDIPKDNIKEFCYLINSSEINARINQAAKRLDNLSDEELNKVISLIKKKHSDNLHPYVLKSIIIEELIKFLEDILHLDYIKKVVIEMIQKYNEEYTQDELLKRKVNLVQICKFGYYIRKNNIIKKDKSNSMMIEWLPNKEDDINLVKTNLSITELETLSFNVIQLLQWYIKYINKRTIESLYNVIENRRGLTL